MKKMFSLALSAVFIFCLSSCTTNTNNSSTSSNSASVNSNEVVFGDEVENTSAEPEIDTAALSKQIAVKEYYYNTSSYYYAILVLKNNSNITIDVAVNIEFLNSQNQVVGADEEEEYAFAPGTEICMELYCDTQFSEINYTVTPSKCESYYETDSKLNVETSIINNKKVIAKVTNNGNKSSEFTTASCIFLKNDKAVDYDYTYVSDLDGLAPGASKSVEISTYEDFDSVLVYVHGRADN